MLIELPLGGGYFPCLFYQQLKKIAEDKEILPAGYLLDLLQSPLL